MAWLLARDRAWACPVLIITVAMLVSARAGTRVEVQTAAEFQEAVTGTANHIVITDHLDLRKQPELPRALPLLFDYRASLSSIQGNCTTPAPTELAIKALKPGQCVIYHSITVALIDMPVTTWMNNLYFRGDVTGVENPFYVTFGSLSEGVKLWVTDTTFEGDGPSSRGFGVERGGKAYVQNCDFYGFTGEVDAPAALIGGEDGVQSTTATYFDTCSFVDNVAQRADNFPGPGGIVALSVTAFAAMDTCTFTDNTGASVSRKTNEAEVFGTAPLEVYRYDEEAFEDALALAEVEEFNEALLTAEDAIFITLDDPEFTALAADFEASLSAAAAAPAPAPAATEQGDLEVTTDAGASEQPRGLPGSPADAPSPLTAGALPGDTDLQLGGEEEASSDEGGLQGWADDTGMSIGALLAIIVSVLIVAVAVLFGLALLVVRKCDKRVLTAAATPTRGSKRAGGKSLYDEPEGYSPHLSGKPTLAKSLSASPASSLDAPNVGSHSTHDSHASPFNPCLLPAAVHGNAAAVDTAALAEADLDTLGGVLNAMHQHKIPFLGTYLVSSPHLRHTGGQGLVQFVQRARDETKYAVKFYYDKRAFERETELYSNANLRKQLLPLQHVYGNDDATVCGPGGFVFPPFVVMEQGESLTEWVSRVAPDLPTTMFVLLHVAERLDKVHEEGFCHRDIKPANVLWRPRVNSWALMDFGFCVPLGSLVEPEFTLQYAAPELVLAAEAHSPSIRAAQSADIWSLGLIAFELLTSSRVFGPAMNPESVRSALAGRTLLPWEDEVRMEALLPKLTVLKRTVLQCLSRNPSERPRSRELLGSWNGMFESLTGTTKDAFSHDLAA